MLFRLVRRHVSKHADDISEKVLTKITSEMKTPFAGTNSDSAFMSMELSYAHVTGLVNDSCKSVIVT